MKKQLRISSKKLEELLFKKYADSECLPKGVVIKFVGIDFGEEILLFSIEHDDVIEDVEILEEEENGT